MIEIEVIFSTDVVVYKWNFFHKKEQIMERVNKEKGSLNVEPDEFQKTKL